MSNPDDSDHSDLELFTADDAGDISSRYIEFPASWDHMANRLPARLGNSSQKLQGLHHLESCPQVPPRIMFPNAPRQTDHP